MRTEIQWKTWEQKLHRTYLLVLQTKYCNDGDWRHTHWQEILKLCRSGLCTYISLSIIICIWSFLTLHRFLYIWTSPPQKKKKPENQRHTCQVKGRALWTRHWKVQWESTWSGHPKFSTQSCSQLRGSTPGDQQEGYQESPVSVTIGEIKWTMLSKRTGNITLTQFKWDYDMNSNALAFSVPWRRLHSL